MANKRDLKKDINYVFGEIIEAVLNNDEKQSKEGDAIIDDAITNFDELIARVNQRNIDDVKAHFKSINSDLESKGRDLVGRINKL